MFWFFVVICLFGLFEQIIVEYLLRYSHSLTCDPGTSKLCSTSHKVQLFQLWAQHSPYHRITEEKCIKYFSVITGNLRTRDEHQNMVSSLAKARVPVPSFNSLMFFCIRRGTFLVLLECNYSFPRELFFLLGKHHLTHCKIAIK